MSVKLGESQFIAKENELIVGVSVRTVTSYSKSILQYGLRQEINIFKLKLIEGIFTPKDLLVGPFSQTGLPHFFSPKKKAFFFYI